jgi:uncharacterized membrane protein (DUF106 family)
MSAFIDVTLMSLGLAFLLSLLYRFLTNPEEMRRIKKEMKFYQDKSKEAQKAGNNEKSNEYMKQMMGASQQQFKQNMKPMLASMLIFFVVLGWMHSTFASVLVQLPVTVPIAGNDLGWFWWYIILTVPCTMLFRKLLGVD